MTTPTDIELQRARFEAWHIEYRSQELTRHDDTYYNAHARCRWEGWQACCTDQVVTITAERDALRKQLAGKTGYVLNDADRELCAIINAAICGSVQCDLDDSTIREALELLVQLTIPETKP